MPVEDQWLLMPCGPGADQRDHILIRHGPLTAAMPRIDWAEGAPAPSRLGRVLAQGVGPIRQTCQRCQPFLALAGRRAPRSQGGALVSPDDNKAIIRTYVETIFNQQQVDRAGELVASDFVDHAALPGQAPGLEGAKQKWAMYLAGIPDLRVTIEELVAEGDKVAVRRSYADTDRGELLGIPPSGKQLRIGGISIFRLTEGKIAEHWEQLDRLALMQQLGVIPAPAAPA